MFLRIPNYGQGCDTLPNGGPAVLVHHGIVCR